MSAKMTKMDLKFDMPTVKTMAREFLYGRGRVWNWVGPDIREALVAAEVMDRFAYARQEDIDKPITARQINAFYSELLNAITNLSTLHNLYSANHVAHEGRLCRMCGRIIENFQGRTPSPDGVSHAACLWKNLPDRFVAHVTEMQNARKGEEIAEACRLEHVALLDAMWRDMTQEDHDEVEKRIGAQVRSS